MQDCRWNGCIWGSGHEGRHEVWCECIEERPDPDTPGVWGVPDPDCRECGGAGTREVGAKRAEG